MPVPAVSGGHNRSNTNTNVDVLESGDDLAEPLQPHRRVGAPLGRRSAVVNFNHRRERQRGSDAEDDDEYDNDADDDSGHDQRPRGFCGFCASRCCCCPRNTVPFCVVVGSTMAMIFVPLFTLCVTGALVVMSFWPVLMFFLPFLAAGWLLSIAALLVLAWFMRTEDGRYALSVLLPTDRCVGVRFMVRGCWSSSSVVGVLAGQSHARAHTHIQAIREALLQDFFLVSASLSRGVRDYRSGVFQLVVVAGHWRVPVHPGGGVCECVRGSVNAVWLAGTRLVFDDVHGQLLFVLCWPTHTRSQTHIRMHARQHERRFCGTAPMPCDARSG